MMNQWPQIPEYIKWVKQEDVNGCAIACCAMICGLTYQEAKVFFVEKQPNAGERPVGAYEIYKFLESHGWKRDGYIHHFSHDKERPANWPPAAFQDVNLCTVVCGPDLNKTHAVVMFRDGSVLDPLHNSVTSLSDYHQVYSVTGWKKKK